MSISVIIPTYNPSDKLITVINGLVDAGFNSIIIIDDGSRADCQHLFDKAAQIPHCTVLHHEVNCGKGRGLKTGFNYVLENLPDCEGVVTTDDDGQHTPEDILRCAEKMLESQKAVLGCRDFSGENVPPKSKFGNNATRIVFRLLCGVKISDTQTGLRAIPRDYLKPFTEIKGERFEYETNMLLEMKRLGLDFEEIKIETIYNDGNKETHFNPLTDSVKIYLQILKYTGSSLLCALIDIGIFTLVNYAFRESFSQSTRIFLATLIARVISSATNYILNRAAVFRSGKSTARTFFRYYTLCILQMLASWLLVNGTAMLLPEVGAKKFSESLIKIIVDTLLYFISFGIQRDWVYSDKKSKKEKE